MSSRRARALAGLCACAALTLWAALAWAGGAEPAGGGLDRLPGGYRPVTGRAFRADQPESIPMRARISPSPARVGQALRYLASVRAERWRKVRFEPPQSGGAFTWSDVHAGRKGPNLLRQSTYADDSVWIEARLQVFETGPVSVPGPIVRLDPGPNMPGPGSSRLPTVHIVVLPTVTAADSTQPLRGMHGPLGAPWWERLPLGRIVGGALLLMGVVWLVRRMRRRKRRPLPRVQPAAPRPRPRLDPSAEAIRALAALRARALPASGLFGEHALELTAILRRFLEATITTPRPGDTSGELLERMRASRTPEDDLQRLEGLLGLWDRVKFARAPLTEAEAVRCEEAVEGYVRRVAQARFDAEAAAARAAAARAAAPPAPSRGSRQPPRGRPPGRRPPSAPEAA